MEYSSWILVLGTVGTALYFYLKHKYSFWDRQGIPTQPTTWLLGNMQSFTANFYTEPMKWVNEYGKVYGAYLFMRPTISVADPQLVKQMFIKDFHYFTNRFTIEGMHELWNKNLFSSNDDNWKRLRMITSPSFSSGKLKGMNSIMRLSVDKLNKFFDKISASTTNVIDAKNTFAAFTTDVIASTSFATETNANEDPNNPFVANGKEFFNTNVFKSLLILLLPKFMRDLLGLNNFFADKPFKFFIEVAKHIVEQRKSGAMGPRNDLVQLLMDARVDQKDIEEMNYEKMTVDETEVNNNNGLTAEVTNKKEVSSTKKRLEDSEIIANCIFFFVAGYETTASTLTHFMFELAQNQDIQERLYQEVESSLSQFDNEHSEEYFETVMSGIPFLEATIKETLRKYPPLSVVGRVCEADNYKLGPATLPKGALVNVLINAIHLNPEYYPNPHQFNPDRFMPENKHQLVPYTYLPFSLGPRNCIATRFAYQELRLCIASIVRKFKFEVTPETPKELKFKSASVLLMADPFSIRVTKR